MTDQYDSDADGWAERVDAAVKESAAWWDRCEKIKKIYSDKKRDGNAGQSTKRMNILWSNVQTIAPVIYSRLPIPIAEVKNPPPGMVASDAPTNPAQEVATILKKALETQMREYDFDGSLKQTTIEYLLTARGTGWIAYEPSFKQIDTGQVGEDGEPVLDELKDGENTYHVFINHKDFITSKARVWEEVTWVGRGLDLTKRECRKNFPDLYAKGKITFGDNKKLRVWEIWDKDSGEQLFISPDCAAKVLKRAKAPIDFDGFFPCPKPLYSNLDNESLIPTPDYAQYQDQANDLNKYTERLSRLGDAMKVRGVYQGVNSDLQRLFDDNMENIMVPTVTPMDKGAQPFQFVPLEIFAEAAVQLAALKDAAKQDIYEITGLSDVLRGQSDPSETATAQNIKNQWGSLRVKEKQKDVQRYIRDILRLKAEVIAELYSDKTITAMTGMTLSPEADKLMRDGVLRKFVIDVETDSTIEPDAQQEKQDRTEFLQALAGYLETALKIGSEAPSLVPMLSELVMFGLKAFPVGNELEGKIKQSLNGLVEQQKAQAGKPPPPDPEMQKAQMQVEIDAKRLQSEQEAKAAEMQQRGQLEQMKLGHQQQAEQLKAQLALRLKEMEIQAQKEIEAAKMQHQAGLESAKLEQQERHAGQQIKADEKLARIKAKPGEKIQMDAAGFEQDDGGENRLDAIEQSQAATLDALSTQGQLLEQIANMAAQLVEGISGLHKVASAPKRVIRDKRGRASGFETIQ